MNLTIRPNIGGPLYRQVFETLRLAIVERLLTAGQRLPATRELAKQMSISRNTVNTAYDMLQAEGYIQALGGSGFFVATDLPDNHLVTNPDNRDCTPSFSRVNLSARGERLARASRPVSRISNPAFVPGLPDITEFPYQQWHRCLQNATRKPDPRFMGYQDQGGLPEFKEVLCGYLQMSRGVQCSMDQIIVMNGSQAGLDLVARMLVDSDELIAMEEPGYLGAKDGFLAANAEILPIPVDKEGIQVSQLDCGINDRAVKIKVIYTTPSYQFPLGITMSLARRLELLSWANRHNAFILEDDYDSEFRYGDRPISCLQGLDTNQRVIYMGTFSKVIFPGLRLGYLVLPSNLSTPFANALRKTGQDAPLLLQAGMAKFMSEGFFTSHIRKMRKLYGQKQRHFVALCQRYLGDWLSLAPTAAGMQIACFFTREVNFKGLLKEAEKRHLSLSLLSRYYLTSNVQQGLYLGYAGIPLKDMEKNIKALRDVFLSSQSTSESV